MNEMIERAVAAAGNYIYQGPGEQPMVLRLRAYDCAIAVIKAMREPTEAMLAVARDHIWEFSPDYALLDKDPKGDHEDSAERVAKGAWWAMIEAALPETVRRCPKCHMEFSDVHSVRCVHRGEYGCCDVSPDTSLTAMPDMWELHAAIDRVIYASGLMSSGLWPRCPDHPDHSWMNSDGSRCCITCDWFWQPPRLVLTDKRP